MTRSSYTMDPDLVDATIVATEMQDSYAVIVAFIHPASSIHKRFNCALALMVS